jgi:hypothetical protein
VQARYGWADPSSEGFLLELFAAEHLFLASHGTLLRDTVIRRLLETAPDRL